MLHLRRGLAGLVLVAIGGDGDEGAGTGFLWTEADMGGMLVRGEERRGEESAYCSVWGAVGGGEEVVSPYASIRRTDDQVWRITQKGSRSRRSQFAVSTPTRVSQACQLRIMVVYVPRYGRSAMGGELLRSAAGEREGDMSDIGDIRCQWEVRVRGLG